MSVPVITRCRKLTIREVHVRCEHSRDNASCRDGSAVSLISTLLNCASPIPDNAP